MTEDTAIAIILALLVALVINTWIAIHAIGENTRLRKALDKADNNDGRDLRTGRYTGA